MTNGVKLIKSGFSLIDRKWGGIYKGGGYLIVGPRKSGRTLLSLKFAIETLKQAERCLFFTTMRPKDLMIQAASLNFDLQKYMNSNSIIVVRVSPPNDVYDAYDPDQYMTDYINDIITVANQYEPDRLIFDELTPYIGFKRLDLLEDVFTNMLETIENKNITSFFVVGEPATEKSKTIVSILSDNVTGTIYLEKSEKKKDNKFNSGIVVLSPNVGHTEGQFTSEYWIEPQKGIVIEGDDEQEESEEKPKEETEVVQAEETHPPEVSELVNIYNIDDFRLILNNQIALYQTTGQRLNLLSFKLDHIAQVKGLLSLSQLKRIISLSIQKRDKLCMIGEKVVVLLVRSSKESMSKMLSKIKSNLPSYTVDDLDSSINYISVADLEINDSIDNSEKLIDPIINDHKDLEYMSLYDIVL
jgi:circadian clock protein KaiC